MTQHNTQQHFLIDVYAIHENGQDQHLGGGFFTSATQDDAEQAALDEFWREELSISGLQPGLHVDIVDRPRQHHRMTHDQPTQQLVSELDRLIPFNEA